MLYSVKTWYKFGNIFRDDHLPDDNCYYPYDDSNESYAFIYAFLSNCGYIWFSNTQEPTTQEDEISLDLFRMIYRRYWQHYVGWIDNEHPTEDEEYEFVDEFIYRLTNIYSQTKERYMTLVKAYKSEQAKLLDGIKTTTIGVGKFNDTPQNIIDGNEFGNNQHISNITKSTAEAISDADTKINRLDEITRKYRNIMMDWTNEFDGLFIESENVI